MYSIGKTLSITIQDGVVEVNSSVESHCGGNECAINKCKVSSDE